MDRYVALSSTDPPQSSTPDACAKELQGLCARARLIPCMWLDIIIPAESGTAYNYLRTQTCDVHNSFECSAYHAWGSARGRESFNYGRYRRTAQRMEGSATDSSSPSLCLYRYFFYTTTKMSSLLYCTHRGRLQREPSNGG